MICDSVACGHEFPRRALFCPKCSAIGISTLYKYRAFNKRTLEILRERKLFFPTADSLNDPFEFEFRLKADHINGAKIDPVSFAKAKSDMKRYGVLALSEVNNNVLMWSHYSDEHKGLCLGFDRNDNNDLGAWEKCAPVIYSEDLPKFEPLDLEDSATVTEVLTTKASFWSYEREWRIIARNGGTTIPFPGHLKSVVFGFGMPKSQRDEVVGILDTSVKYFETQRNKNYYRVDVVPIANALKV